MIWVFKTRLRIWNFYKKQWSSLIYSTSARNERHKCNTSATLATRVRHEWDTSDTIAAQVGHDCYTNDTSATPVLHGLRECDTSENFDFDNDTSKNIFSHSYFYYMASEIGEEQFYYKNYFLEISLSYA